MKDELEKLMVAGKINRQQAEALLQLFTNGFGVHKSWGVGKLVSLDAVFSKIVVDFQSRPGHTLDLAFAAESLRAIPSEHILAKKLQDLESLRKMAGGNHIELIKLVLNSFGGKATQDQIQQSLVPDVIKEDWKKWWEAAKREMKKDGHFQVPSKKNEPIIYQAKETSLKDRFAADFRAAKGLKAKLAIANEIAKNFADLEHREDLIREVITSMNADIVSHQRTQPALALEAIFLRDELHHLAGTAVEPGEIAAPAVWAQIPRPGSVLETIPAAKHRRALQSFKEAYPNNWAETLLGAINNCSAKLAGEIANLLIHDGKLQLLKDYLARVISQHMASSELLLWLAKERSDAFADILGPEVFRAMLSAMERDQFQNELKRSSRLGDFIMNDQSLLVELIGPADLEVIKDLTRALQLSPCFDDMDKRSLLARIVKSYPAVQSLISGEQSRQESSLIVSWESLERRKNEYEELVQRKIPANSKEIAIARSYGDLRENHEFKAAKEMQKLLMRRKSELEQMLVRARGMDFSTAKTDAVNIGTQVHVTDLQNQHEEQFSIMGAWDSDPEKGIISYLTPIGQALLNHKPGDEVEFEFHGVKKRFRINSIGPGVTPSAPVPSAPQPGAAQPASTVSESAHLPEASVSEAPQEIPGR